MPRNGPRVIGFVGDIHCGSRAGLWPVDLLPSKGFLGARFLWQQYQKMVAEWPKTDLLVLMGDLIDGKQRKSDGVGLFTADLGEQAEVAATVLRPLADKADRIVRVWGTPYHETHDSILGVIDKELGVSLVDQVISMKLDTGVLNVAHHPASGSTLYSGTVVDRESRQSIVAAYEKRLPDARWIVRAHKHHYYMQETDHRTIVLLPCWQQATPHAKKQNYWIWQPDIGGVLMVRDDLHPSGYRFIRRRYETPAEEVYPWSAVKEKSKRRPGARS